MDAVAPPPSRLNSFFRNIDRRMTEAHLWPSLKTAMCSPEQRNNLYLLMDQVIAFGIEGDVVELGCYEGHTARVIASVLENNESPRHFHVYDHFHFDLSGAQDVRLRFEQNFLRHRLPMPQIHEGPFHDTLPDELPEHIAFAHIDCGMGDLPDYHAGVMRHCLESIYQRMSPGAIGVLMDYHDQDRTIRGWDCNPGVKLACDRFFRSKPEYMQILYGNQFSHAFFRKVE
jgi:O-methyltransferase